MKELDLLDVWRDLYPFKKVSCPRTILKHGWHRAKLGLGMPPPGGVLAGSPPDS